MGTLIAFLPVRKERGVKSVRVQKRDHGFKRGVSIRVGVCFLLSAVLSCGVAASSIGAGRLKAKTSLSRTHISCTALSMMVSFVEANHLTFGTTKHSPDLFDRISLEMRNDIELSDPEFASFLNATISLDRLSEQLLHCDTLELEERVGEWAFTRLAELFLKGFLNKLDAYSDFITSEEMRQRMSMIEGQFVGVGVATERHRDFLVVMSVLRNTPAERAGLKRNDRIVRIDDKKIEGWTNEEISAAMRGREGTKVILTVLRGSHERRFEIERDVVAEQSVYGNWLDEKRGVAYIQIARFFSETARELMVTWFELNRVRPVRSLVLDLRFNPGGLLHVARDVVDMFIDKGPVVHVRGTISETVFAEHAGVVIDVPMVVMVNQRSASAAEIVAGALQSYHRALIVGAKTYGKSTVQTVFETDQLFGIPYSGAIKLTGFAFYLPDGRSAAAIRPDVPVRDEVFESMLAQAEWERKRIGGGEERHGISIIAPIESFFRKEESAAFRAFRSRALLVAGLLEQKRSKNALVSGGTGTGDVQFEVASAILREANNEHIDVNATGDILSILDLSQKPNHSF